MSVKPALTNKEMNIKKYIYIYLQGNVVEEERILKQRRRKGSGTTVKMENFVGKIDKQKLTKLLHFVGL